MKKIVSIFSFLLFLIFSNSLFAEMDIELLKNKYPKCENENYRHECFDEYSYSNVKEIGYFRNNSLWDGQIFINDILDFEYVDGEQIAKSFCHEEKDGWFVCRDETRYKPFDGGYLDSEGKMQGKFIVEYSDGSKFVGEFKDAKRHGQGTFSYLSGGKYVGKYKNDNRDGQGTYTFANGDKYVGEWKNGVQSGKGTSTWVDGDKYEGEYKEGLRSGQGTFTFASGDKYVGEYQNGKKHGKGTLIFSSGAKYVGEWKDDKWHGQGTYTFVDEVKM